MTDTDTGPYSSTPRAESTGTPKNPLRQVFSTKHAIGPWVISTDPAAVEVLAQTALDFLVLDCQHGPHDLGTVGPLLRAAAIHAKPVLLRVPSSDPWIIMRALDLGAAGVIVPMVSSAVEAEKARAATRYPPLGERSFGALRSAAGDVFDPADGPVVFAMIETNGGLADAEAIAAVPGIDGLFVGPVDLALAVGAMPDGDLRTGLASPVLHQAITTVAAAAATGGKILAGAVFSPAHARAMASIGMTVQVLGTDVGWLTAGAAGVAQLAAELRETP